MLKPSRYCVRPNSGLIHPNGWVDVQVLLQAMKEDPPLDAKCRDKFLVQSVLITSEDVSNIPAIWQTIEKTAKSSIQERKIRVNFLPAEGATSTTNGVPAPHRNSEEPPAYSSPSPQFGSPATHSAVTHSAVTHSAVTSTETKDYGKRSVDDTNNSSSTATAPSTVSSVAAVVSSAVPTSQEDLKQQLADAKAQISKLTSQLGDPQLRQRKVQEASEKMQTVVQQTGETGVPVQIVAGLCLLSFLLAYFFF
ncbi:hypothetical protein GJ744_001407 [Endocarpon pusillum]|uniref:MSP domain-containing protein n=1 Tax=Endocarpon pusillum TaxID=364733 RepID=A0A8H7E7U6_9EURO|nr:hypothetical protein GJ744_001407 [Endocarpon pusillum]